MSAIAIIEDTIGTKYDGTGREQCCMLRTFAVSRWTCPYPSRRMELNEHGAPLVLKSDNGSAFNRSRSTAVITPRIPPPSSDRIRYFAMVWLLLRH